MSETGQTISAAVAYLSKVGTECEALAKLIKQELGELLRQGALPAGYQPAACWSHSYRTDASEWVFSAAAWTLPLECEGNPAATQHLAFQMSFLCDDAEGGYSPEPLLHINLWASPTHVKTDEYMGFPMYSISARSIARLNKGNACLFRWDAQDETPEQWTYTLRLARINALEDVRRLICAPVRALLANVDDGERVLDDMPDIVRWSTVEGTGNCYRVVR